MRTPAILTKAFAAVFLFALAACQTSSVAEYKKYESDSEIPRISVEQAKKDFDAGKAVFVDSRQEAAFKADHVKGAINIPFGTGEPNLDALPKGKKIIIYCS